MWCSEDSDSWITIQTHHLVVSKSEVWVVGFSSERSGGRSTQHWVLMQFQNGMWPIFILRSLLSENLIGDWCKKRRLTSQSVLLLVISAFSSTGHHAKLNYFVTLQPYFNARFFMCLNMDYETDKPIFTVKQSLNCLLAIEVNEVCLMLENLVSLLRAGSWN